VIGYGLNSVLIRRGSGLGQQAVVTSEIISPDDPRYIDVFPGIEPGGGISYPGTAAATGATGGPGGSPTGIQAGGSAGGTDGTGTTTTGSGPFGGGGGGSGWGLGPGIKCTDILGNSLAAQAVCGTLSNLVWWVLAGAVVFVLLEGRKR
jgi:hypothetical protein